MAASHRGVARRVQKDVIARMAKGFERISGGELLENAEL
jgi:hypothetical protein